MLSDGGEGERQRDLDRRSVDLKENANRNFVWRD